MYFQVEKIILWSKKVQYSYKTVNFCCDKINVITGASRTGKSAIIPIIDYCLGDGQCQIPVNTIRDACSWFGIIVKIDEKKLLLARREPGQHKVTDDMMLMEGEEIEIPEIPGKNTTCKNVRRYLDELARVTFLELNQDEFNGFTDRPSFRDMMAFCYQTQNIVANANTLFYKADTMEHRTKLINIFPYILGAITPEILAKRQELNELQKKLKRKERELQKMQEVSEKWRIEIGSWINAAKEIGLIDAKYSTDTLDFDAQMNLLKRISQKSSEDDGELQEEISELQKKIIVLQNEINEGGIRKRFASALENIELKIMKLLPLLDTERPEDSVKIDYKNLTITVTSKSGRKDYLWEIGSGSNWLSYHISVSLAFQMFFAEKKYSPIPQFIVYDQPSQVYFPNKAAQKEEDKDVDPHLEDEDILAVKKIFEAMSEAMEKTKHRMQIIVLEHADESAWEGVSNMHLVEEWRGENNKLIPNEWLD